MFSSSVFIATGTIKKNQSKPMPDFSERLRAPPVYECVPFPFITSSVFHKNISRQFDENTTVRW
jgi:hypothetical protein